MSIIEQAPYVLNAEVEKAVRMEGGSPIYLTRKIIAESSSPNMKKCRVVRDRIKFQDYSWYSRNLTMGDAHALADALVELADMEQSKIIEKELMKHD